MQKLILISLLAVSYLAFQNCAKTNSDSSNQETTQQSGPDDLELGGNGYDGKVYVHVDPSLTCGDGTHNKGAIGVPTGSNTHFLIRSQCQNITPQALSAADVQVISPTQIIYQSETYIDAEPPPPPPPPPPLYKGTLLKSCNGSGAFADPPFVGTINIMISREATTHYALVTFSHANWVRRAESVITPTPAPPPNRYTNTQITFNGSSDGGTAALWLDDVILRDVTGVSGRRAEESLMGLNMTCP
jgi:hypothetical protein